MPLTSASFAYPQLDGSARAAVAASLPRFDLPANVFVLSTCLRVEVSMAADAVSLKQTLTDLLGPLRAEPIIRHDDAAAAHLFRVAAGLDSPIIGEVEILTQFRKALAELKERGLFDGGFVKLLEAAVAAGRDARCRLDSSPHDTMAAIAAQVVGAAPEVAVLGSGTMARAVVSALQALPAPPRVVLMARSPEQVAAPGIDVRSLEELPAALAGFPAMVAATAAASALVEPDRLHAAVEARERPLLLVDMAMPPDFRPGADTPLEYVDIDDLAAMAWKRPRTNDLEEQVLAASIAAHHRFSNGGEMGQVIARLLRTGDAVVDETVDRFAGRLSTDADRDILRQAAHTVARTILARPVDAMRNGRDRRIVESLSAAFDDD